eukprot:TRINITY_DN2015_c0_g2_i6.p1 TRINITY_DN2015_c0_g2~~TRINITY_DN2015_c0_g2_i6.p1  ORF type:complete len:1083 (-),score=197.28 TRINITY_DN2015_c0_g2_i6:92-3340(-)
MGRDPVELLRRGLMDGLLGGQRSSQASLTRSSSSSMLKSTLAGHKERDGRVAYPAAGVGRLQGSRSLSMPSLQMATLVKFAEDSLCRDTACADVSASGMDKARLATGARMTRRPAPHQQARVWGGTRHGQITSPQRSSSAPGLQPSCRRAPATVRSLPRNQGGRPTWKVSDASDCDSGLQDESQHLLHRQQQQQPGQRGCRADAGFAWWPDPSMPPNPEVRHGWASLNSTGRDAASYEEMQQCLPDSYGDFRHHVSGRQVFREERQRMHIGAGSRNYCQPSSIYYDLPPQQLQQAQHQLQHQRWQRQEAQGWLCDDPRAPSGNSWEPLDLPLWRGRDTKAWLSAAQEAWQEPRRRATQPVHRPDWPMGPGSQGTQRMAAPCANDFNSGFDNDRHLRQQHSRLGIRSSGLQYDLSMQQDVRSAGGYQQPAPEAYRDSTYGVFGLQRQLQDQPYESHQSHVLESPAESREHWQGLQDTLQDLSSLIAGLKQSCVDLPDADTRSPVLPAAADAGPGQSPTATSLQATSSSRHRTPSESQHCVPLDVPPKHSAPQPIHAPQRMVLQPILQPRPRPAAQERHPEMAGGEETEIEEPANSVAADSDNDILFSPREHPHARQQPSKLSADELAVGREEEDGIHVLPRRAKPTVAEERREVEDGLHVLPRRARPIVAEERREVEAGLHVLPRRETPKVAEQRSEVEAGVHVLPRRAKPTVAEERSEDEAGVHVLPRRAKPTVAEESSEDEAGVHVLPRRAKPTVAEERREDEAGVHALPRRAKPTVAEESSEDEAGVHVLPRRAKPTVAEERSEDEAGVHVLPRRAKPTVADPRTPSSYAAGARAQVGATVEDQPVAFGGFSSGASSVSDSPSPVEANSTRATVHAESISRAAEGQQKVGAAFEDPLDAFGGSSSGTPSDGNSSSPPEASPILAKAKAGGWPSSSSSIAPADTDSDSSGGSSSSSHQAGSKRTTRATAQPATTKGAAWTRQQSKGSSSGGSSSAGGITPFAARTAGSASSSGGSDSESSASFHKAGSKKDSPDPRPLMVPGRRMGAGLPASSTDANVPRTAAAWTEIEAMECASISSGGF